MFHLFDSLIEGIFGKNNFVSNALRTVVGVATMGGIGYLAYKGVKYVLDQRKTPKTTAQKSSVSSSTPVKATAANSGAVKLNSQGQWVPVDSGGSLQNCNLPNTDPRYNKYSCGEGSSDSLTAQQDLADKQDGMDTYKSAFESYQAGLQDGTSKKEDISAKGSTWTTKLTAGDGTVLYKDGAGNIATKNEAGSWVITDKTGQYVETT